IEDAIRYFGDESQAGVGALGLSRADGYVVNMSFAVVPCNPSRVGLNANNYQQEFEDDTALGHFRTLLNTLSSTSSGTSPLTTTQMNWFIAPNPRLAVDGKGAIGGWDKEPVVDPLLAWLRQGGQTINV